MRSLVILRGSPGSGKSTWIKTMGLENYTLCADTLRMLVESPILTPEGLTISQKNDSYIWMLLFELLEKRMERGEFIVIDATHSRSSDFSKYNALCEKYRYRKYYVDFSDVPIEVCKKQNLLREPYKQVPEIVIDKMYSRLKTQGKTSGWVKIDRNHFWEEIGTKLYNFDEYKRINVFGDIHGCFEPLKSYFSMFPYNEDEFYIFCGDYLDRGIQNKDTLQFLMDLSLNKNVLFLEGNHEKWLRMYSNDELENIKSKTFLNKTIPEIIDIDKKDIRAFCRKIAQIAYFSYGDINYIITHGGLSYVPNELQLVANDQFINGVGDYNVDIDDIYAKNCFKNPVIQIHGHRNTYEIDDTKYSYNLEGKVEFGGNLKVLQLFKTLEPKMVKIKNDIYADPNEIINYNECRTTTLPNMTLVEQLRNSKNIKETKLDNNISSFNFTRNAFYSKKWDDLTIKARGLFLNTETNEVVARGYDKFFNIGERRETEITHLASKFQGPIVCYEKYNGYLGILSMINGELFFASKSTNNGDYAKWFKEIFDKSNINRDVLEEFLSDNNVSLTFEVIDPINDPHIIKYEQPKLVLLDIINNNEHFYKWNYEEVIDLGEQINCEYKQIYKQFDNFRNFHKWYIEVTDEENDNIKDVEGVVVECNNMMTKLKFQYYNFWKFMRRIKEQVARGSKIQLSSLYNDTANYFYDYCKKQDPEFLKNSIITLREDFYKNYEVGIQ